MLPPLIEKKLQDTVARHAELEGQMADPEVLAHPPRLRAVSRECGTLAKIAGIYSQYASLRQESEDNEELSRESGEDAEIRQLAKEEIARLAPLLEELERDLTDRILVDDKDAGRDVIVEVRAGTGGDEAALFAGDLFRMYTKYAELKKWKIELIDGQPTALGGFKEIIFSITGQNVHRDMRYEMGGHRVQRVPQTETSGRIHTSAATVAVMGEPEEVEIDLSESDIRMDFYRSSGPGGQNVNKTSSAVRLTHIPTGIVVAIQDESSQHKNRAKAMRVLRSRIYEHFERQRIEKEQDIRRSQVGSGDRNQRIRTYNFPQNRCTDHRISQNFNLERIVEGHLEPLTTALRGYERDQRMKDL